MSWHDDDPVVTPPAAPEPAPSRPPASRPGLRRGVMAAALGALLLVGGGVAAVSAASPEPSDTPAATQGTDGTTVEPDATGQLERVGRDGQLCPDEDGSGGNGTDDGSSNSSDDSNSDASASDV
jgi:hypothetical protein